MKTKSMHHTSFPSLAFGGPALSADGQGHVTWLDDEKYAAMSTEELYEFLDRCSSSEERFNASTLERNAVELEIANRRRKKTNE